MTEAVKNLQIMLRQISDVDSRVLPVIPNGVYGAGTFASVRSFQEAYGLPVTGETDLATWNAVEKVYTRFYPKRKPVVLQPQWQFGQSVRPGDSNLHLYLAQTMLLVLSDFYVGAERPQITGNLDKTTENGLKWVQRAAGLREDGVLDAETWHALTALYRTTVGTGET